jgi:hypothetical protein
MMRTTAEDAMYWYANGTGIAIGVVCGQSHPLLVLCIGVAMAIFGVIILWRATR